MILLSSIIKLFESELRAQYRNSLLPSHYAALEAMKTCRTSASPSMLAECTECDHQMLVPHSCGHRSCPHCQHHERQQWLERQLHKLVPGRYFLVTFTLPAAFRPLAFGSQHLLYSLMIQCAWHTLTSFAHNDKPLQGTPGAIAVLHIHTRRLDYHPHVHMLIPAAAIDAKKRLWRVKRSTGKVPYLFNHKALAKVFRAKLLDAIVGNELELPACTKTHWVVDCTCVGSGKKALIYLGRYLYRGVIREGEVTFRYKSAESKRTETRMVSGAKFLWLILQHVLPKGFRRARNFGFLHHNSKRLIALIQYLFGIDPRRVFIKKQRPSLRCPRCGADMQIIKTRLPPGASAPPRVPIRDLVDAAAVVM